MNRTIRLGACLLALVCCAAAAEPTASVKNALIDAEKAWTAAVLKGDRNALDKLLTADLSYTHSSAKTQTKEEFIQSATDGSTTYKSIEFENTKMRQYGTTVVITHSAQIVTAQTGASHLYITEVWAQDKGHWQMASRQATKLP